MSGPNQRTPAPPPPPVVSTERRPGREQPQSGSWSGPPVTIGPPVNAKDSAVHSQFRIPSGAWSPVTFGGEVAAGAHTDNRESTRFNAKPGTRFLVPGGSYSTRNTDSAAVRSDGPSADDDAAFELLAHCADLLASCATQMRLYGPEHPEAARLMGQLETSLNTFLTGHGSSEWLITANGFWLGSRQFTLEKDDRPGLSHYLHTEGLATLRFDPGVTRQELVRLLMILRTNLGLPEFEEETLESILYQAEFEHISFEAVSHLRDAEALSGRREELNSAMLLERLVKLEQQRNRDLAGSLGDRDTRTGERVSDSSMEAEGADWDAQLARSADKDIEVLRPELERLDMEREADHLVLAASLLLRASACGDPAMPAATAMELASSALRQLYALGDATCLLRFFEEGHRIAKSLDRAQPGSGAIVDEFLRSGFAPLRVARMLRSLRTSDQRDFYAFQRLTSSLSSNILVVFLDGIPMDSPSDEQRAMVHALWSLAGDRLLAILDSPESPPAIIVTVLNAAVMCNTELPAATRTILLRNRATLVRAAALPFFRNELPEADVPVVVSLLTDRVATVRKAAADVLVRHRGRPARTALADLLDASEFADMPPPIKTDVCVTIARVGGPQVFDQLVALFNLRTGLKAEPRDVATLEAAARGLAALRTTQAMELLEKAARGWPGPKRAAAAAALQESRTPSEQS